MPGLKRVAQLARSFRTAVKRDGVGAVPGLVKKFVLSTRLGNRFAMRGVSGKVVRAAEIPVYRRTYKVNLPQGWPAREAEVTLSVPAIPPRPHLEFAEHVTGAGGSATDLVLASAMGGFGISHDLGTSWKYVKIAPAADRRVLHVKRIGEDRYLLLVTDRIADLTKKRSVDLVVANEAGDVISSSKLAASPWHGCRSLDVADGVLMYAEYPYEIANATPDQRDSSRVWRSRDMGVTWEVAFEVTDVRHFHFLQARPGHAGEWWLTSGDGLEESRIYVSKDAGDTWRDITAAYTGPIPMDGAQYPRTSFRLTDLAWTGDDVVWGTDDFLYAIKDAPMGARVFRSPCADIIRPEVVGRAHWQIRNMVDVGDFFFFLTQGGNKPDATMEEKMPGVFLVPKTKPETGPALSHLFDVDVHSQTRTGFTYSRASRAAKDGVFFTYRASTDAFPTGHKMLKWEVKYT